MPRGEIDDSAIVPIAGDGGIGHPDVADGRIIPVLIVDCANHRPLYDLISLHGSIPGDVSVTWGRKMFDKKNVYLILQFEQPIKTKVGLRLPLAKYAGLVDGIIRSRGLYLQPSECGFRVSEGLDKPKILLEIPSGTKLPDWEQLLLDTAIRNYREAGAPKKHIKQLAREHIRRNAEIWIKRAVGTQNDTGISNT